MKDHPDRSARLQLIESMFAGQPWQVAAQSNLRVSRTTAYRLVQLARDEEKAASAFLDDRHGHPDKMTEKVARVARRGMHQRPADPFQSATSGVEDHLWNRGQSWSHQLGAGTIWSDQAKAWSGSDIG